MGLWVDIDQPDDDPTLVRAAAQPPVVRGPKEYPRTREAPQAASVGSHPLKASWDDMRVWSLLRSGGPADVQVRAGSDRGGGGRLRRPGDPGGAGPPTGPRGSLVGPWARSAFNPPRPAWTTSVVCARQLAAKWTLKFATAQSYGAAPRQDLAPLAPEAQGRLRPGRQRGRRQP